VRLMIPPGGTVLDPYAGSGTTGVACAALGVPAILIDNNPEYCEIMARRIDHALNTKPVATQPDLF
jgi:site-specific DNA-methyltransferase (adenine-specific)